jgi:hypothetical protein
MSQIRFLLRAILTMTAVCAIASSCEKVTFKEPPAPPPLDTTKYISFSNEIVPIFQAENCTSCHNAGFQTPDFTADQYNALVVNGDITPADSMAYKANPDASKFYHWLTTNDEHIPRTNASEKALIRLWVSQGARNN